MAALGLYELGGEQAERALIANVPNVDAQSAATVALALGRIGSPDAVRVTQELEAMASPDSKSRAAFGTSLLAYRHNLPGHEVQVPGQMLEIAPSSEVQDIQVNPAAMAESNLALVSLEQEPVDVDLTTENAQQIVCPPNTFLFLWNRHIMGSRLRDLQSHKGVIGLVFRKSRFKDAYDPSALVLATPRGSEIQLTLHRSNGSVQYAGSLVLHANETRFMLRTAERPGSVAIEFSGAIVDGRLTMEAAHSAVTALRRRQPKRAFAAVE
jgi:hypothetical protein